MNVWQTRKVRTVPPAALLPVLERIAVALERIAVADGLSARMPNEDQAPFLSARAVDALLLGTRAKKVLGRLGIVTVGDLTAARADSLLRLKNCGATTVTEIRRKLAARGLALYGEWPADWK